MSETTTPDQNAIDTLVITPAPATLYSGSNPPPELCTETELGGATPFGPDGITALPNDMKGEYASVSPPDFAGRTLSVVVLTIEPGSCLGYHPHEGANVLLVQSGEIDYAAQPSDQAPDARVTLDAAGAMSEPAAFGVFHRRTAGQWVTQDQEVYHSVRNAGSAPATVIIAANSNPVDEPDGGMMLLKGCIGGCHGRGR